MTIDPTSTSLTIEELRRLEELTLNLIVEVDLPESLEDRLHEMVHEALGNNGFENLDDWEEIQ